jgi:hypothetical protein
MTLELPSTGVKCDCELCRASSACEKFKGRLPENMRDEFNALVNYYFERGANAEMELEVLQSKIEGSWPKEDNEQNYHRIGDKLYEIHSTFVVESKT